MVALNFMIISELYFLSFSSCYVASTVLYAIFVSNKMVQSDFNTNSINLVSNDPLLCYSVFF